MFELLHHMSSSFAPGKSCPVKTVELDMSQGFGMALCMHTHMHTHAHTHAHTCTHTHAHTCTHMHTHMHTHAHTHAYTCIHMRTHSALTLTAEYMHINTYLPTYLPTSLPCSLSDLCLAVSSLPPSPVPYPPPPLGWLTSSQVCIISFLFPD